MTTRVFVAGATGYTGRSVVAHAAEERTHTVAHVRPDSRSLSDWRTRFDEHGATVDVSPWTPEGMAGAMDRHRPDVVFALLGTTARRARRDGSSYEEVDYGLTVMLLRAVAEVCPETCFVYLSAAGAHGRAVNAYMSVRTRVEAEIRSLGVPHLIARPGFITGRDRDENRPAERAAATVLDGALSALAMVGLRGPREKWHSITGSQLGRALVTLARARAPRSSRSVGLRR
jgi:uncharacterized protein YbjT (DUF2867 family)